MGTAKDSEVTRAKIIKAAGNLFAKHGLKGVTVRTIVKVAETHLSALNYHFNSKDALYQETLAEACQTAAITEKEQKQLLALKPEKALYILIKETLKEYSRQDESNWEVALINRECREPSEAFEKIAEEFFKPEADFIAQIISKIVNKAPDDQQVRFAVISLIALLEMFGLYGHMLDAFAPGFSEKMNKKDWIVKQIVSLVIEAAAVDS